MGVFEMVVVIVLITAVASIIRAKMGVHKDARGNEYRIDTGDSQRLREEVKVLKDRIAVLERLATDNNRAVDLDREIEKLR